VVATALVYGLSMTVRVTSPTGEEVETSAQGAQSTNPMTSIMINDHAQSFYKEWSPKSAPSIAFQRGWPLASTACRVGSQSSSPNGGPWR
jgi:hypothetical protein